MLRFNCSKILFTPKQSSLLGDYQPRARRQKDYQPARGTVTHVCGHVRREKAKLSTMLSAPVMEFPVFNPLADTSFLDCILGNGKPQTCNHQSVSALHAKLQLTQNNGTLSRRRVVPCDLYRSCADPALCTTQCLMTNCIFHLTCCHIPLQASVSRLLLCVPLNNSLLAICSPALYITEAVNMKRPFSAFML